MSCEIEKAYKSEPLSGYSVKDRALITLADLSLFTLIELIGGTLQFETDGIDNLRSIENAGKVPIYTFWHDRIFGGTYFFRDRGIVVMTSRSLDGEYIARFIKRLGYGSVRGSSSRGGVGALVEMIRLMKMGLPMGFTIDGPRGPRYVAKKGAVLLAKKTGNPVMPFVVESSSFWTVKSWDLLQVPKPFSKAKVIIGDPIYIPEDASEETIEQCLQILQLSLDSLVAEGEKWRKGVNGRANPGIEPEK